MSLSSTIDTPTFVIDSHDSINGNNELFEIKLDIKKNNDYNQVSLIHAGIPKSYYDIDSQNSGYTLTENGISQPANLPSGDYTIANASTILNAAFDAISSLISPATPWTYSFAWNSFEFKWDITVTEHAGRVFANGSIGYLEHTINHLLGFPDDSGTVSFVSSGPTTAFLKSTNVANFERTKFITIKSNIAHNDGNSNPDSQLMATIPVNNAAFNDVLIYDLIQLQDGVKMLGNNKSNVYSFGIYDDHNRLLNLNGRHWFLTLFMYKHNDVSKLQIEEIKFVKKQRKIAEEKKKENLINVAQENQEFAEEQAELQLQEQKEFLEKQQDE